MTDPRIEAAARALCTLNGYDPEDNDPACQSDMGANWCAYICDAEAALAHVIPENQRLREALQHIRDLPFSHLNLPASTMHSIAHKALKGPEV